MAGLVDSVKEFFSKKSRNKRRDRRQQDIVLEARLERFTAREAAKKVKKKQKTIADRLISGS